MQTTGTSQAYREARCLVRKRQAMRSAADMSWFAMICGSASLPFSGTGSAVITSTSNGRTFIKIGAVIRSESQISAHVRYARRLCQPMSTEIQLRNIFNKAGNNRLSVIYGARCRKMATRGELTTARVKPIFGLQAIIGSRGCFRRGLFIAVHHSKLPPLNWRHRSVEPAWTHRPRGLFRGDIDHGIRHPLCHIRRS